MAQDPFKPPASNVDVPDTRRGSPLKAVVIGAVVDFGGTMVASVVFFMLFGVYLAATGTPPDRAASEYGAVGFDSPIGLILNIVGCMFSVLGGFVCARIAKHAEYRLGAILAAVSVALGFLLGGETVANGVGLVTSLLTVASVMVGAHLGAQKNRHAARQAASLGAS